MDVRLNTAIDAICAGERTVSYIDPLRGPATLAYDRLILATGTVPIVPPIEGLDGPNVFCCRTVPDVDAIMQRLSRLLPREMEGGLFLNVKDAGFQALVIGGGYIGLECMRDVGIQKVGKISRRDARCKAAAVVRKRFVMVADDNAESSLGSRV